jgi:hypothetical protein
MRGRPRRTSFVPWRKSAPTTHSLVISGASSLGEVLTERFRFALMAVPHANDSPGSAVVKAIIYAGEVIPGKDLFGPAHIEPPLLQRALTLRGIAGDAHELL